MFGFSRLRIQRLPRHLPALIRRLPRSLSLSQRFLILAALVIGLAMLGLGSFVYGATRANIISGIANTAAASIEPLIEHQLVNLRDGQPLSAADRQELADVFDVATVAHATRLLQARVYGTDGSVIYQSPTAIPDPEDKAAVVAAGHAGEVTADIVQLALGPVGPIASHPLEALKILTPIRRPGTAQLAAIAELYYSVKELETIERRAEWTVWGFVGSIGVVIAGILYLVVDRASRTIARQRQHLADNLAETRQLLATNRELAAQSESLRANANVANENLLAFVGAEIHDGPIQLLALIVLKLTAAKSAGWGRQATDGTAESLELTTSLATRVIEELRTISTGLALPELANMSLRSTIELAVSRHTSLTGVAVECRCKGLPKTVSPEIATCVYRIIQEALSNAFRHGDASRPRVWVGATDAEVNIEITNRVGDRPLRGLDDGRQVLGVRGMQFRAESVGGALQLDLSQPSLARVVARIPYIGAPELISLRRRATDHPKQPGSLSPHEPPRAGSSPEA